MRILYPKTGCPATSPSAGAPLNGKAPTKRACLLPLLLTLTLTGCDLAASTTTEAELSGREKIELRDALRGARDDYERRQVMDRYEEILRRREMDRRLAVEPSAPPPPQFPRPLDQVPAVDERELGGIVKERGKTQ